MLLNFPTFRIMIQISFYSVQVTHLFPAILAQLQEKKMHQCSLPPCGFSWWDRTRQGWIQQGVIDERGQVSHRSTTAAMGKDNE